MDTRLQDLFEDSIKTLDFIRCNKLPTVIRRKLQKQAHKDKQILIGVGFKPFHEKVPKTGKIPPLMYLAARETARQYEANIHEIHSSLPNWLKDCVAFEAEKLSPHGIIPVISKKFLTPQRFRNLFN